MNRSGTGTASKPRVVVSKCIEFDRCRYNGLMISSELVAKLKDFVEFVPVCPEVEIGLGVPRDPIRIIRTGGKLRLVQPATGRDLTDDMERFAARFLDTLAAVDGFILKGRSPSCGLKEAKIFPGPDNPSAVAKGMGFFGNAVMEAFPLVPVEDEGRLTNFRIREHFLTRVFTLWRFRKLKSSPRMKDIIAFQAENKLLLMAYNQKELRVLGRIVANFEKHPIDVVLSAYEGHLLRALSKRARYASDINVLMHALGYFSEELKSEEKAYFLDSLEQYRSGKIPLSACLSVIRSWIVRFDEPYLEAQTYFEPYPAGLVEITDSGKGRKM
jgi:uncharacterized protein YbgA (DUF1722 family)/uncharacterized protein YbbK (DUF523 family)